jgi:ferritin-like protein
MASIDARWPRPTPYNQLISGKSICAAALSRYPKVVLLKAPTAVHRQAGQPTEPGAWMMATSAEWHENYDRMSETVRNYSRAVKSLQEELEAVDWYNQRAAATVDTQLRRILEHNRDEEIEHAMMALEYLRRIDPVFDRHMRTYLFTTGDITEIEAASGDAS